MNAKDKVMFDHMGKEHAGVITDIVYVSINNKSHQVVYIRGHGHMKDIKINVTLFPRRVRTVS